MFELEGVNLRLLFVNLGRGGVRPAGRCFTHHHHHHLVQLVKQVQPQPPRPSPEFQLHWLSAQLNWVSSMTNIKNTTVKSAKPALAKGDFGPWGWSCPLAPEGGKGVGWSDYHWLEFRLKSFAVLPVFHCMPHLGFVLRGKNWQFIEVIVAIGIDSLVLPAEIENICFVHSLVLDDKMEVAVYSSHQCHQCWHWNRQSWSWKLLPPAVVFFITAINAAFPFAKLLTIFCFTCTQSGNLTEKSEW